MKHRKLFLPALTAQNQTTDCPNYSCDPVICPYNCYSDYYYFPPPPPPPPPLPISSQEPHRLSPFLIVVISLLASFFLLLGYYVIVIKRRNNRQPPAEAEDAEAEEGLDHNRIDHPIWFITTIGLQQSIINSITVCRYKKGEGLIEGTDCSVCLSEFQEDETLRLLPKCNHAFHISCIDTWLRTHTNCPLCRARIVHDDPVSSPPPPHPVSQNPDSLDSIARTQMENSATDGGLSNNQERNEACENRGETEQVTSEGVKNEINVPIRRSFSMDSVMAANLCLESEMGSDPANILEREERDSSTIRPTGSSSIVQCLTTSPISMRRSFSCGGRFFSSRQNRSVNSILPR